ncbi:MAG: glutathione peroxidase, partial [Cryomorphaceae bacterium]
MKSLFLTLALFGIVAGAAPDQTIYQFTMKSIEGEDVSLSQYSNKVVLIVNVASKCGLTPQYEDLQALYDELGGDDFV